MKKVSRVTHMGLDCHKKFSVVTGRDAEGKIVLRERLNHADRVGMREQMSHWPAGTPVILEGSFGWGWMCDELTEVGHDPHLASSRKVGHWREARGCAKSNRVDADLISELWDQQSPRWWEVWLAPQEVRDQREWLRYRMGLVGMQTMTKMRIHATLHRHGILHPYSDLFGKAGRQFLAQLTQSQDVTLRESTRQTLAGMLRVLTRLRKEIAQVTRELRRQVKRSSQAELWRSLPGVGWVLAYTIQAEVGEISRFTDGRHLSSYSLLTPIAQDSGEEDGQTPLGRHVGHAGRRTLKWAFIEAAHGAVRKSRNFKALWNSRTNDGKRDKNRGYIAVARQLALIGTVCVKKQRRYSEERPVRPGEVKDNKSTVSDPGCTGPDHPMAAAVC